MAKEMVADPLVARMLRNVRVPPFVILREPLVDVAESELTLVSKGPLSVPIWAPFSVRIIAVTLVADPRALAIEPAAVRLTVEAVTDPTVRPPVEAVTVTMSSAVMIPSVSVEAALSVTVLTPEPVAVALITSKSPMFAKVREPLVALRVAVKGTALVRLMDPLVVVAVMVLTAVSNEPLRMPIWVPVSVRAEALTSTSASLASSSIAPVDARVTL